MSQRLEKKSLKIKFPAVLQDFCLCFYWLDLAAREAGKCSLLFSQCLQLKFSCLARDGGWILA